ncbi:hypothetical protein I4U23_030947 [Adineta vaga]|nr:hypothetical protein I4U23_030947 [Adineta vaga]
MVNDKKQFIKLLIYSSLTIIILYLLTKRRTSARKMNFSIENQWNSKPIIDHQPVQISLSTSDDKNHLVIKIDAPFFNDPAPPTKSLNPGPYPELWNYEVVELFFLSSSTNHYLELEFSPHGHYLVLLLLDRRKELKQMLPLPFYQVERPSSNRWIGQAQIPRALFPAHIDRFNAYAIHGENDQRIYESLYPAPIDSDKPDFHRLEFFRSINFNSLLNIGENDGDSWMNN